MKIAFVDYGFWIALEFINDQNHRAAKTYWSQVVDAYPRLVTTSYVFDEVVTFFNGRGYHAKAVEVGSNLLSNPLVQLIHVDDALFYKGWAYLRRHQDKAYSLTDCISFVIMQELGISTAFAFDKHFVQSGFQAVP